MSSTTRSVIVRLRAEMGQFRNEWRESGTEVRRTTQELDRAARQQRETEQAARRSATGIGQLSNAVRNNREEWDHVGSSLLRTGAALGAITVLVAKAAIDWESAWAGVTKTVDATPDQLAEIETGLRDLAKSMPTSHQEIAAVAEAAGQLGVRSKDIVAFTKNMVMLGDTTNLTADEAATSIAQLMNVMQTAPDDVDRLSSTLVALGNSGASTEREIIQMAQRIAGAGEIVGLSEANVLSLANALASSGIEVEAGGSAISSVLIDISKSVSTNSEELGIWAKTAGMSAQEFSAKWKADPISALADFTEGLGQMSKNGENVFGVLDKLGQSDIRTTRALLNMANAGDLLRNSISDGDAAWQRNNALVKEAEKRYDTTAAKIEIAWNNIKDNAIDAGQGLLPIISGISDAVSTMGDAFGKLPGPVKDSSGLIIGISAAALLAMGGIMKLTTAVVAYRTASTTLAMTAPRTAGALGAVSKAAGVATAALIALQVASTTKDDEVAGVNKFTDAILRLSDGSSDAKKDLQGLAESNSGLLDSLTAGTLQNITGIFSGGSDDLDGLASSIKEVSENASDLGSIQQGLLAVGGWNDETGAKTIAAYDAALAGLVSNGAIDEAATGFDVFASEAERAGLSTKEATKLLPSYAEALAGVKNEQKLASDSAEELSTGAKALDMTLAELGGGEDAQKMLADLIKGSTDAAMGFLNLAESIDPAKTSMRDWLADLEKQAEAMDAWADNMIKATSRGVDEGVIAKFKEMGPEGAARLAELVEGSQEDIDRLNEVWGDAADGAQRYGDVIEGVPAEVLTQFKTAGDEDAVATAIKVAEEYNLTPDQVETILRAMDYASEDISKVLARAKLLDGTNATVDASISGVSGVLSQINAMNAAVAAAGGNIHYSTGYGGGQQRADGGPIDGVGGPKQDNILVAASVGEHMWTAREVANVGGHGAMYAMRAQARAGKRPQYADGGAIDDAWNASYRAAAAAYGAPVRSQAASTPIVVGGGSSTLAMDDRTVSRLAAAQERGAARGVREALRSLPAGQSLREMLAGE